MLIGAKFPFAPSGLTPYLTEAYRTFLEANFYHSFRMLITGGHGQ